MPFERVSRELRPVPRRFGLRCAVEGAFHVMHERIAQRHTARIHEARTSQDLRHPLQVRARGVNRRMGRLPNRAPAGWAVGDSDEVIDRLRESVAAVAARQLTSAESQRSRASRIGPLGQESVQPATRHRHPQPQSDAFGDRARLAAGAWALLIGLGCRYGSFQCATRSTIARLRARSLLQRVSAVPLCHQKILLMCSPWSLRIGVTASSAATAPRIMPAHPSAALAFKQSSGASDSVGVEGIGDRKRGRGFAMAYELQIRNRQERVKIRSPWAAALLPIVTLGIYHLVWWYRIHRELHDYGRAKGYDLGQSPMNSLLALFPGGLIIVPALITYWRGTKRIQGAARISGKTPPSGWIALILYVLLAPAFSAYLQVSLNDVWHSEADPLPGQEPPGELHDEMPPRLQGDE